SSRYAIDSENGRKLSESEKKIIIDLLTVYRNLKFFPDVFGDAPIDQWNILPVKPSEVKKEIPLKTRAALETARTSIPGRAEKAAAEEKSAADEQKMRELREALDKYPASSLQRKAVEEEIKKLEGRSRK
ncbi:MAG TPA: hypothetical protein VMC41_01110, partial [Candidatus Nanoarchaeia archaeon]|nr:hypothetical protein [Candidatus Nanoarchaeia archaeon]